MQAVKLVQQVGWPSIPVEQQHGSLAMLKKWHPGYELRTLVSRALVLQVSRLMPAPSKQEKEVAKLCRRIQRLDHLVP